VSDAGEAQKVEGTVPSQWLLDEKMRRQRAEAECGRLREQLDAARQALREIAGHDGHTAFEYCVPMMVEAARAALGVEGEP
jgi:hypothetical protein